MRESKRIPHFGLCDMCVGRMKCCAKDANLYSTLFYAFGVHLRLINFGRINDKVPFFHFHSKQRTDDSDFSA